MVAIAYPPVFRTHPPPLWVVNDSLEQRAETLDSEFRAGHYGGKPLFWKFSSEIEFTLDDSFYYAPPEKLREYHQEIETILRGKMIGDAKHDRIIESRISQLGNFTLKDITMFQIYETLGDGVEQRFGKASPKTGYYDGSGCSEVRLTPAAPRDFLEQYHHTLGVIREVSKQYLGVPASISNNHVNFSLNYRDGDKDINLFETKDKDKHANSILTYAFGGILKLFRDTGCLRNFAGQSFFIDLGVTRGHAFRMGKNRGEFRHGEGERDHMANYLVNVMGGAAYGITRGAALEQDDAMIPVTQRHAIYAIRKGASEPAALDGIRRALIAIPLSGAGPISLPDQAVRRKRTRIALASSLLGYPARQDMHYNLSDSGESPVSLMQQIFSRIDRDADGNLDLSRLRQWESPPSLLTQPISRHEPRSRLQLAIDRLSEMECKGSFQSYGCDGYEVTISKDWSRKLIDFLGSRAVREAYGEPLIQQIARETTAKTYAALNEVRDHGEVASQSALHEQIKLTQLLKAAPSCRTAILKGLSEGIHEVIRRNDTRLLELGDRQPAVTEHRIAAHQKLLLPLLDAVANLRDNQPSAAVAK